MKGKLLEHLLNYFVELGGDTIADLDEAIYQARSSAERLGDVEEVLERIIFDAQVALKLVQEEMS